MVRGAAVLDTPYSSMVPIPEAVVRVGDSEEVWKVVKLANTYRAGLAFGDSLGPVGRGRLPREGGLAIDCARMNRITETRVLDLFSTTEPAATLGELNSALGVSGFFFPPASGLSDSSTLARSVVSNTALPRACGYGRARNYLLRMKMVTPTGDLVELGSRTLKNSSGLQIERFIAGSDGLFGIPVEFSVAVKPRPEEKGLAAGSFSLLKDAIAALSGVVLSDLLPVSVEVARGVSLPLWSEGDGRKDGSGALLVQVEGHPEAVRRGLDSVGRICKQAGATSFNRTLDARLIEETEVELRGFPPGRPWSVSFRASIEHAGRVLEEMETAAEERGCALRAHAYYLEGGLRCSLSVSEPAGRTAQEVTEEIRSLTAGVGNLKGGTTGERFFETRIDRSAEVLLSLKREIDPNQVMN